MTTLVLTAEVIRLMARDGLVEIIRLGFDDDFQHEVAIIVHRSTRNIESVLRGPEALESMCHHIV